MAEDNGKIEQAGEVTPGHAARWLADGVIGDAGGAAGSTVPGAQSLTEIGVTNTGTPIAINDALINSLGGYHQLALGANSLGGGLIAYNAYGGAATLPLYFEVNGTRYEFPFTNGYVVGPPSSTVGNVVAFNNSGGTLVKDTGVPIASVVTGPNSSTAGDIVTWANGTGNGTTDSAVPIARISNSWLTPQEYGAVGDGVHDDTAALNIWFAALLASGRMGFLPEGTYRCTSALYWNLSGLITGLKIAGAGGQRAVIDLAAVSNSPALLIGGTTDLFCGVFRDFGITGNLAGTLVQVGHEDYSDPCNDFIFDGIVISNASTSASAVALELNYVLNSQLFCIANNGGHGDALRCRQATFNVFRGSYATADICVHFRDGYNFGNVFVSPDFENCATCVQSDIITCVNNTFLGGQYVWTGTAIVANSASNYLRFILPNFGVSGTLLSGASAAAVLIEDRFIGTSPFGGILISPPAGDGDASLDSVAGNSAFAVFMRAGSTRWQIGRNNAAETGGNAGSQLIIVRFNDSGVAIDNPVAIDRSTGIVTLQDGLALPVGSVFGAFGAVPAAQPGNTGNSNPSAAGSAGNVLYDTTFTGGIGATGYTVGQIVAALKTLGLIAS